MAKLRKSRRKSVRKPPLARKTIQKRRKRAASRKAVPAKAPTGLKALERLANVERGHFTSNLANTNRYLLGPGKPLTRSMKLRFFDSNFIARGGADVGGANATEYSPNDLFDPYYTGTGKQPWGFQQLSAQYNRYVVTGCKIKLEFQIDQAGSADMHPIKVFSKLWSVGRIVPAGVDTLRECVEQSMARSAAGQGAQKLRQSKWLMIENAGLVNGAPTYIAWGRPQTMVIKLGPKDLVGLMNPAIGEDFLENYGAVVGASPPNRIIISLFGYDFLGGALTAIKHVDVNITMDYDVTFYEPANVSPVDT